MKTKLFFFAMLISMAASAQTGVTVTPVSVKSNIVTFNVSWLNSSRTGTHNSKVWIFVDYRPVTNNVALGSWERALIAGMPTATSGTPTRETTTDKGFWLQGTSGSSGTYHAAVTVTLSNVPAQFNWCAYVSDYPPNMVMDEQTYYFKGTPPFILKEANGTIHEITQTSMPKANLTFLPVSITDKTECPGGLKEVIRSCAYTGTDWYADPEHKCQQRPSGAQNWEAYIKDSRDNELYRIVLMPDELWWTAEEMRYDASTTFQSYKCPTGAQRTIYNRPVVACPAGWILPSVAQFTYIHNMASEIELLAANTYAVYGTGIDLYGFSVIPDPGRADIDNLIMPTSCIHDLNVYAEVWDTEQGTRIHCMHRDPRTKPCFNVSRSWNQVRCLRQL